MIVRPSGVVVHDHRLLVMHYQYGNRDRFNLPGGKLEPGEEAQGCLVREFAEELNLEVTVGDLLFCADTLAMERHVIHLIFSVVACAGTPCLNPNETRAQRILWLSPQTLDSAPLYPAIAPALATWMRSTDPQPTYLGRLEQEWFS